TRSSACPACGTDLPPGVTTRTCPPSVSVPSVRVTDWGFGTRCSAPVGDSTTGPHAARASAISATSRYLKASLRQCRERCPCRLHATSSPTDKPDQTQTSERKSLAQLTPHEGADKQAGMTGRHVSMRWTYLRAPRDRSGNQARLIGSTLLGAWLF